MSIETMSFWDTIDLQLKQLRSAKSAQDVLEILPGSPISSGEGFFEGSGGDGTVFESLQRALWSVLWFEEPFYWAMRSPDGASCITYIEGDIFAHDTRADERTAAAS